MPSDDTFLVTLEGKNASAPQRKTEHAAGYDVTCTEATIVPARGRALVPIDQYWCIPAGTYARIAPRSSLAWKHGLDIGAGVVDLDYAGKVAVVVFNHSDNFYAVKVGEAIAQAILVHIATPPCEMIADRKELGQRRQARMLRAQRSESGLQRRGGFGSTDEQQQQMPAASRRTKELETRLMHTIAVLLFAIVVWVLFAGK
jgi:dUTP pyrophosphatase